MRENMPVLQDGCILQRIFDGTVKTNKVNVKAVWQKHAIATLMEPSVLWTRERLRFTVWVVDLLQTVDTLNASQVPVTDNLNLYVKKIHLVYKYKNQDLIWMPLPPKSVIHGFIYSVFLGY